MEVLQKRFLLVHLASNGDCLMATTIARQIKSDFPDSHLTWAIGSKCRQVIDLNPYIDAIWEVPVGPNDSPYDDLWRQVKQDAEQRKSAGEFDDVFYTQIYPDNLSHFDGTTRSTTFSGYPYPVTVPVSPSLVLSAAEIGRVRLFSEKHQLSGFRQVLLFECSPSSQQSFMNLDLAIRIAERVVALVDDVIIIISTHKAITSTHKRIIDGSALSYRENAELSKYCTFLIGCSSGITWLLTSEWAKKLPTLQLLSQSSVWYSFASVAYDHQYFKLPADHIFETDCQDEEGITDLIVSYIQHGHFAGAKPYRFQPSVSQIYHLFANVVRDKPIIDSVIRQFKKRNPEVHFVEWKFWGLKMKAGIRLYINRFRRGLHHE
jgi:hypothetical protein